MVESMGAAYVRPAGAVQGCFPASPWHLRTCLGEQFSGSPFMLSGF
jgi:hypothetical protein